MDWVFGNLGAMLLGAALLSFSVKRVFGLFYKLVKWSNRYLKSDSLGPWYVANENKCVGAALLAGFVLCCYIRLMVL